ncbi:hypothetical protein, partial [Pseudomonas viridiflava]|uniref:hypothetical protein n=1 Tax=Pseudomonas viridiflava TaxID=33069 RepID=UPI0019D06AC6
MEQILTRGRRLAGDAVDAVCQENRVIVHRRQAASHNPVVPQDLRLTQNARTITSNTKHFGQMRFIPFHITLD